MMDHASVSHFMMTAIMFAVGLFVGFVLGLLWGWVDSHPGLTEREADEIENKLRRAL